MAECGRLNTEQGQNAISGSEFVFDFYCELCRDNNLNVEAEGYCVNCEEYLCTDCIYGHTRTRQTRHHEVLDQASMPKDTPLSYDRDSKDISTLCQLHKSKTVEYYCESHEALVCLECFATVHKHCSTVESVLEKSENILDSQEYGDFVSSLSDLEQRSRDMAIKARANITITEQVRSEVTHQVRKFKEDFIEILEDLEASLIYQVETVTTEDTNKMERLEQELSSFTTEIESLKSEIQPLVTSKRVCQLYIHMKERNNRIAMLARNLGETEQNIGIRNIAFEANDNTMDVVKTTGGFGKIVIQENKSKEVAKTALSESHTRVRGIKSVLATHVSDIDFSTDSDKGCRHFAISSAVVSSTRLLVADFHMGKVKLLDTDKDNLISEVKLQDYPFDIAVINENQAIVSTYNDRKLLSLKINDTLKVETEIAVNGNCRGVAYYQNQLFVTYENNPRIEVMDLLGHVLRTIQNNANGVILFKYPRNVHVSPKDGNIFVSDTKANIIFCLTMEGEVKHQYGSIRKPRTLCSDQFGHLYVADFSSTVHITAADFSESKTLLTDKDGLQKFVSSVSYCKATNCVFLGMSGQGTVKTFKLI